MDRAAQPARDVRVVLDNGARLAREAQRELITNELWQARHRDYAAAGVRDVWFMRPDTRIPHVLFAEGTPAWTLSHRDETAEARLGEPHERGPLWWTKDLRLFRPHHPPCAGAPIVRERFPLADLGLDADGVTFPPAMTKRLAAQADRVRREADQARRQQEQAERWRHEVATRPGISSGQRMACSTITSSRTRSRPRRSRPLQAYLATATLAERPRASGLGAPADVETLTRRTTELEQQVLDLRGELAERDEDLEAARAADRELMAQLNR